MVHNYGGILMALVVEAIAKFEQWGWALFQTKWAKGAGLVLPLTVRSLVAVFRRAASELAVCHGNFLDGSIMGFSRHAPGVRLLFEIVGVAAMLEGFFISLCFVFLLIYEMDRLHRCLVLSCCGDFRCDSSGSLRLPSGEPPFPILVSPDSGT
ncbi:uncharacterized protein G2W53_000691 [Senna tora]|uniref:Uncharacterized protein n=1 Tax=Senna tora TaxID=362788 RepID=A0A834XH24_9FABA|nr:uncharacterized protein G2W53_000691 [Senna tora]